MTSSNAPTSHPEYRPDIDGLRAVAVGLVIGYHYFPNHIQAGFIGVDVFFVISGYLITSIILRQFEQGDFSYRKFYTRRVNRIFPALLVVVLANLLLGGYALVADEFSTLGKNIAASSLFVSNFALWNEAGYFDAAADTKPLLHLWSLAIEEQFYIVWPLLLGLALRHPRRGIWLVGCALAASFAYNLNVAPRDAAEAYYSPLTRGWQLAAGGLVAYLQRLPLAGRPAARNVPAVLGLALLLAGVALIERSRAYPGWWAVLPTAGTALLIAAGPAALPNRSLLALRPLVWVGLISYPLYLWHWVVLVWTKLLLMSSNIPALWRIGLALLALALATLTYRLVERPIRHRNVGTTALSLAAAMAVAGAIGVLAWTGVLGARLAGDGLDKVVAATKDWGYPPAGFKAHVRFPDYTFYRREGPRPGYTLFVGDSNMEQYGPRIEAVIERQPDAHGAIVATKGGCPFTVPLLAERMRDCKDKLPAIDALIRSADVDTVVFAQAWLNLLALLDEPAALASFEARLASVPAGRRKFIVLNMPSGMEFSPTTLMRGSRLTGLAYDPGADHFVAARDASTRFEHIHRLVREVAARHDAVVIDPFDTLCTQGRCALIDPRTGAPAYRDTAHLTASFARESATFIDATLLPTRR